MPVCGDLSTSRGNSPKFNGSFRRSRNGNFHGGGRRNRGAWRDTNRAIVVKSSRRRCPTCLPPPIRVLLSLAFSSAETMFSGSFGSGFVVCLGLFVSTSARTNETGEYEIIRPTVHDANGEKRPRPRKRGRQR